MSSHSNLCIWVRIELNSSKSEGIVIPLIGALRGNPDSFLLLQVAPLNSSIVPVNALKDSSSGVLVGNSLISTALIS